MDPIALQKVDESNFIACFDLKSRDGQENFVSHPIRSLAQAYVYHEQCTPFAVFSGSEVIGYVMVIYDYDEETYNIWHLTIDGAHQGKGYGRAAMELSLDYVRTKPFGSSSRVLLTVNPENRAAFGLYRSLGFSATGRSDEEEIELGLTLD